MPKKKARRRHWTQLLAAAEAEAAALLNALPGPVREAAQTVPIVFDCVPGQAMVRDGVDPDLMGLFVGDSCRDQEYGETPRQISLFLENIWDEAGHDMRQYRHQVRKTLLHEIGHYVGLEEDDLALRGME